jgi:hypothetical protein
MTTKPPPTYYFSGITFNSGYYTTVDENPLTQLEADARYLIKTQNDTTNNLQTFSGGIDFSGEINGPSIIATTTMKSNAYQSTSINQLMAIGNNQIGVGATMSIGCNTGRLGNINIANTQTTGTANIVIGSNAITGTGSQNITINRPLTIGYSAINDLQYSTSKIGSYLSNTSTEALITNNANPGTTIVSFSNIPPGIYMFEYQINYRITVANTIFSKQNFLLSTTLNDFLATNIIEEQYTSLYKNSSETVILSNPTTDYLHKFSKAGIFVLSTLSDVYLNYRIQYTASTTVPYIIGSLRLVRIG